MVLKGGVLQFINEDETIQKGVILDILQEEDTRFDLISPTTEDLRLRPERKSNEPIGFVFKIIFNGKFMSSFTYKTFPETTVIMLKFFTYNTQGDYLDVVDEINTQKQLAQTSPEKPLCPSYLYHQNITDDDDDEISKALSSKFLSQHLIENKIPDTTRTIQEYIIYAKKSSSFNVTVFFMEFLPCSSLLNFCGKSENFRSGRNAITLEDKVVIQTVDESTVFGLYNVSFTTMALHLITIKLFKLGFIHNDLHASNVYVFIDANNNMVIMVIDLGSGCFKITPTTTIEFDKIPTIDKLPATALTEMLKPKYDTQDITLDVILKQIAFIYIYLKNNIEYGQMYTTITEELAKPSPNYTKAVFMIKMCKRITLNTREITRWHSQFYAHVVDITYMGYNPIFDSPQNPILMSIYSIVFKESSRGGIAFYKKTTVPTLMYRKSKKRKKKTINRKKSRKITRKKLKNRRQK
jgi:hypothetical protein